MKHLLISSLFLSLLAIMPLAAQNNETKDYIYLPYDYNFCLDEIDMSILIPSGWGFKVPSIKETDATLKMYSDVVNYSYYSGSYKKTNSIFFIKQGAAAPCMELVTTAYGSDYIDESSISSEFGHFHQTDEVQENKNESYQMILNSQVITFHVLTKNDEEKEICKNIVASAKSCYDVEFFEEAPEEDYLSSHYIRYYAKDSTYYPSLGFTFITPFDISSEIRASKININETQTLLTAYVTLDEISGERAGDFEEGDFSMKYYFLSNEDEEDNESILQRFSKYDENCTTSFEYPVSGILASFYLSGSALAPKVITIIPTTEYKAVFIFDDVDKEKMEKVSDIISQILIDDKFIPAPAYDTAESLQETITYRDVILPDLKTVTMATKASLKKVKQIEANITDLGATIYMPDFGETYLYPSYDTPNSKKKKYTVNLSSSQDSGYGVSTGILSTTGSEGLQCVLWIPENEKNLSVTDYLTELYAELECTSEMTADRLAVTDINGQKWYIVNLRSDEYPDAYLDMYVTEYKGKLIELRLVQMNDDKTDRDNYVKIVESLLSKSTFK